MRNKIVAMLIAALLKMIKPQMLREKLAELMESIGQRVEDSETQIDDVFFDAIIELNPEMFKVIVDKLLDFVEDAVADSGTQIDDMVVLPLIDLIRVTFDIPDNDIEP